MEIQPEIISLHAVTEINEQSNSYGWPFSFRLHRPLWASPLFASLTKPSKLLKHISNWVFDHLRSVGTERPFRQDSGKTGAILCRYCQIHFHAGHVQISNVYSGSLIRVHSLVRLQVDILTYGFRTALFSCERYTSVQHSSTRGRTQYRYFSFAEITSSRDH